MVPPVPPVPPVPSLGSGKVVAVRDTATTGAPAAANAVAIPRPRPRLAPTTIVVLPDRSLMMSSYAGKQVRWMYVLLVLTPPATETGRDTELASPSPSSRARRCLTQSSHNTR